MTTDASPLLDWTEDGEPRSGRFGDVYFSRDDGLAESRAVFLAGCGLPEAWAGRTRFTVAELGFGTGLNIAALLDLWRAHRPDGGRLHILSVEGFPLTAEEAARALSAWPELVDPIGALLAAWPSGTPGFHRLDLPGFSAVLDLAVGDVAWALSQWRGRADAWFLDGFSPALNPAMWSPEVMDGIAARSAPGARVATFTVAGAVRRGLAERGFAVEKRPGHGRKRERLEARLPQAPATVPSLPRVVVIGAGIAGAATARALAALGVRPTVIEAVHAGAGGSGFPAALVTPRMDAGDAAIAGLHAQALERAGQLYEATPGAVIARGVLQLAQAPRDTARFDKIAAQSLWPRDSMTVADADAAGDWTGEPQDVGGLAMAGARVIQPAAVLSGWLADADMISGEAARLERAADGWRVLDATGAVLAEADVVVVAGGWGAAALLEAGGHALPLSPVRGQAEWTDRATTRGTAWGGYVAPTADGGLLFGATHDRGEVSTDPCEADAARNLATLRGRLPQLAYRIEAGGRLQRRAAIRATTPDRLPVAGEIASGLHVLTGLGSRGFCVAPLLGEHLAATITGAPSPLPGDLADRLSPTRFDRSALRPGPR